MLREYAIDPDAIYRNLDSLQRFLTDFHAENGRVVAAVPRNWFDEQKKKVVELGLPTMAKRNVLDKLTKIKNASLISGYTIPRAIEPWLEQALHIKAQTELNGIMSSSYCAENQIFDYSNLLMNFPNNWEIDSSISVPRTAVDLSGAIERSLILASAVLYVDPYFTAADNRFVSPLMAFIRKMEQGRCKSITIHTTDRGADRASHVLNLQQVIKPLLSTGFTVKLFLWQRPQMHDRFILTKNVGYSFGHGLDEAEYATALAVNIDRLSESARVEHFRYFSSKDDINDNVISVTGE
ncbi:hypothetical protein [Pseudoalteromonas phenolica]|uniref:hypothetical protein n=1 Tax=Pseudoalteromonas phenolica TaxID=161398 RepID=UPI00384C3941